MKYYALTLRADSPLAVRSDHAPGGAASAQYIQGTTLAGSLAAAYRLYYGDETGFQALFLREQVWFPNLYPASFKNASGVQEATQWPIYPLPKTAQSCKRFFGFKAVAKYEKVADERRHGVRDSLLDWAMFSLLAEQKESAIDQRLEPLEQHRQCPVCKNPMDHLSGYYRPFEGQWFQAGVDTRLQTHTGISRETGTVQEGILYNRQVVEEDSLFWGLLKVEDHLAQPSRDHSIPSIEKFIAKVGEGGWLRVGTGRTRGLGKVGLRIEQPAGLTNRNDFRMRLEKFHTLFKNRVVSLDLEAAQFYFALTLHSPAILCNNWHHYYTTLDASVLKSHLHLPEGTSLKLIYQSSSTRRVSGWNELWGTPRPNEIAIDTGSVFLFACDSPLDDTLSDALFQLEEAGIGKRTTEGFGRICISDPFHQEVELR